MLVFEPQISGVGSDRSANWATTTAELPVLLPIAFSPCISISLNHIHISFFFGFHSTRCNTFNHIFFHCLSFILLFWPFCIFPFFLSLSFSISTLLIPMFFSLSLSLSFPILPFIQIFIWRRILFPSAKVNQALTWFWKKDLLFSLWRDRRWLGPSTTRAGFWCRLNTSHPKSFFFRDGPFPASFSLFSSFQFKCTIGR